MFLKAQSVFPIMYRNMKLKKWGRGFDTTKFVEKSKRALIQQPIKKAYFMNWASFISGVLEPIITALFLLMVLLTTLSHIQNIPINKVIITKHYMVSIK